MIEPHLRELIGDPRYRARGAEGDQLRTTVSRAFQQQYPGEMPRDATGRQIDGERTIVSVRAYDRRGENNSTEHVSAHQRGAPRRDGRPSVTTPRTSENFRAPMLEPTPERVWETQPNPEFRQAVALRESSAQRLDHGYGARTGNWSAIGRYSMLQDGFETAGWQDAQGNWTARAAASGVRSREDFLSSPLAQEQAFTDYLNSQERQLRRLGAWEFVGTRIQLPDGSSVLVTPAGLTAAAHYAGPTATRNFIELSKRGLGATAPRATWIAGRLRLFADVPFTPIRQFP